MATISFYAENCSYTAHASFSVSPDPYPNGIPCPKYNVANITGTVTIRYNEVWFADGYGLPADVYVNGSYVDYLQSGTVSFSSTGVTSVRVVPTKISSSTQKGSVVIDKSANISGYVYYYYLDGVRTRGSSTASRKTIAGDVGTDIEIYSFSYTSTNYGEPVTFAEYTSTAHTTLITSWEYPTDPKIRIKSSTRYFVFTPSVVEKTYYGRFTLNANGGSFPGTGYTSISWPTGGNMSNTGTGGAYVSTSLPTAGGNYVPTRSGYGFLGWATSSTATSANYLSGQTVGFTATSTSSSSPTKVTLYAVWSQKYTLSYTTTLSGVSNMPSSSSITGVGSITVSSTIPKKSGYTFKGWAETSGGAVKYVAGNSVYMTANKTLYAVFEKITISLFYWTGTDDGDSTKIAKGQPVSNLTATMWNNYLAKVKELSTACGVTFTYTAVSSGSGITASRFNSARTGLVNIKNTLGGSTTLPSAVSQGQTILASYFIGVGSLRNALNGLINIYNSQ